MVDDVRIPSPPMLLRTALRLRNLRCFLQLSKGFNAVEEVIAL
jgi:hypothetical protein